MSIKTGHDCSKLEHKSDLDHTDATMMPPKPVANRSISFPPDNPSFDDTSGHGTHQAMSTEEQQPTTLYLLNLLRFL